MIVVGDNNVIADITDIDLNTNDEKEEVGGEASASINDHAACRKPCKRKRGPPTLSQGLEPCARKRPWTSAVPAPAATEEETVDYFDGLPDDLVVSVLSELSSSADRPSDLISALLTYDY
ncbi:hypothetical protein BHE74_00028842 [Ensete ventricosum]|nr:hypothetical protein GW17_00052477 [Ensete ventricosum]RWW63965.1 hypothetical protein BHE74_00028842 [Ensete ventricosum]RZS00469.1 hypothetical protein BHM03_00030159 [Ensete ventricosum]